MDYKTLSSGIKTPALGSGVYQVPDLDGYECAVSDAILVGYRSIDTARAYINEKVVRNAIRKSGTARKEFFITAKIWISNYGYEKARAFLDASLAKLRTNYIGLVLLHQPFGDCYGAYRAMEEYYKAGKIEAIDISNFASDRVVDLAILANVTLIVNQVETHVFSQQLNVRKTMDEYDVRTESWGSFVEGRNDFFINETLVAIGQKYHKPAAQVALRHLIQRDVVIIPKTVYKNHMEQNFSVFDFVLASDDMAEILKLDMGEGQFFPYADPETVKMISSFKI